MNTCWWRLTCHYGLSRRTGQLHVVKSRRISNHEPIINYIRCVWRASEQRYGKNISTNKAAMSIYKNMSMYFLIKRKSVMAILETNWIQTRRLHIISPYTSRLVADFGTAKIGFEEWFQEEQFSCRIVV